MNDPLIDNTLHQSADGTYWIGQQKLPEGAAMYLEQAWTDVHRMRERAFRAEAERDVLRDTLEALGRVVASVQDTQAGRKDAA